MKKFKKVLSMALITALTLSAVGCGSDASKQGSEDTSLQEILDKGKIVLGTSADYAPYEFHILDENGEDKIVGFDINIAEDIAEGLGVELEIVDMNFDGLLASLNAGQVDMVISGMTPTEERKQAVDFSDVYYLADQSVLVKTENLANYPDIASLAGKKVAAQKGTIQEEIVAAQIPDATPVSLTKIPNIIVELKNGTVDAAVVETPVAKGYVKNDADLVISDVKVIDETGGSAIAFRKGSTSLVNEVNKIISEIRLDGSINQYVVAANEMVETD